jgi:hypothetical protein
MAVRTFLHYALEVPYPIYVWGPPCPADFGENKEAWT